MKKIKINVEGMHCTSCANILEKSLSKVKGIKEININVIMGKAFLETEDNVTEEEIRKAVKNPGYTPKEIEIENI